MPHLVQVAAETRERGGQVLGISQDLFLPDVTREQALQRVEQFVRERGIPFPMLVLDDEDLDGVSELYDLPGPIPVTLAFDGSGREVDRQEGGADLERLRAMMRRALGEAR